MKNSEKMENKKSKGLSLSALSYGVHYFKFEGWRGAAYCKIVKQEDRKNLIITNINSGTAGDGVFTYMDTISDLSELAGQKLALEEAGFKRVDDKKSIEECESMIDKYLEEKDL